MRPGVVIAYRLGRPRKFAVCFWLTVASVWLYSYYWDHKVHDELYKQFELAREGRDQGTTWYIFGLLFFFFRFVYYYYFVANVQYLRARFGMPGGIRPGVFLGHVIPAVAILIIGGQVGIVMAANAFGTDDDGEGFLDDPGLLAAGILTILGSLAVYITLEALAYWRLQRDVNLVWEAYDRRMAQITAPAAATPSPAWQPFGGASPAWPAPRP